MDKTFKKEFVVSDIGNDYQTINANIWSDINDCLTDKSDGQLAEWRKCLCSIQIIKMKMPLYQGFHFPIAQFEIYLKNRRR